MVFIDSSSYGGIQVCVKILNDYLTLSYTNTHCPQKIIRVAANVSKKSTDYSKNVLFIYMG